MHVLSRIMVKILGLVGQVLKFPKPFSFVGPDASLSLVREIIGLGVKRVMVITDGQLLQLGIVNPHIELLREGKVEVECDASRGSGWSDTGDRWRGSLCREARTTDAARNHRDRYQSCRGL